MKSASQLIYEDAGSPDVKGKPCNKPCAVCGGYGETGLPIETLPGTFTAYDQMLSPDSDIVCSACVWAMSGRPPDTLRLWSFVYRETGEHIESPRPKGIGPRTWAGNKADMSPVRKILLDPPEGAYAVTLADSGQIHVLPFAPVSVGREWSVQLDRHRIDGRPEQLKHLLFHSASLLLAGFGREEVEKGVPNTHNYMKAREAWHRHMPHLDGSLDRRWCGSRMLSLSLFIINKRDLENVIDECRPEHWGIAGGSSTTVGANGARQNTGIQPGVDTPIHRSDRDAPATAGDETQDCKAVGSARASQERAGECGDVQLRNDGSGHAFNADHQGSAPSSDTGARPAVQQLSLFGEPDAEPRGRNRSNRPKRG